AVSGSQGILVSGYVGKFSYHRPNRKGQIFFVNNRYVKSSQISEGLESAFNTLLPINRFPFAIIKVQLDPAEIDINIHPTKLEVKFSSPEAIKHIVKDSILKTIHSSGRDKLISFSETNHTHKNPTNNSLQANSLIRPELNQNSTVADELELTKKIAPPEQLAIPLVEMTVKERGSVLASQNNQISIINNEDYIKQQHKPDEIPNQNVSNIYLKPIGQLQQSYIVCEGSDCLYLVDQHAAHERIIFEKLMAEDKNPITQPLLIPESLNLSPAEADILVENIIRFRDFGFILEHFGGSSFIIREVPQDLALGTEKDTFYELLELFQSNESVSGTVFKQKALTLISCKKAVKAGDFLEQNEMILLLEELLKCSSYETCPHGRPTIIKYSMKDIAKKFLRQ
ncbi:MAG: DNA mismatch repair endonuclease MutL, partial [Bacillota bacterium]|nr:DNA mismatch repair endonuclease MutL [Bacillota bacterium]